MADVIVIGGGVIGLSIAYELAGRGMSVRVLEQGEGREASWAGAGMLPPGNLAKAKTPEARLRAASHSLWPDWSAQLRESTGIDNGYHRCGGLLLPSREDALAAELHRHWADEGVTAEWLNPNQLRQQFPFLFTSPDERAVFLPEMGQVRNPRHLKALLTGCANRGVRFHPYTSVIGIERSGEKILSVRIPDCELNAGEFVFAAGAWSQQLLRQAGIEFPVEPVRGQIVLLDHTPQLFRSIIEEGKRYLVPRPDGKILVGSTEEHVGFLKANTAEAVSELIRFAIQRVPELTWARFVQAWSGLRPHRAGELPYLGRVDGLKNACVAAGHFRSGLQMSPITAVLIRQVMMGQAVQLPEECRS